jgi:hypothetical protein
MNEILQFADIEFGDISITDFFIGFFLSISLGLFIKYTYEKYSLSVTNKKLTSNLFPMFSMSIFVIVVTIKSSIVLSLGLVGALSIIRLRTAIKDAEQLIYFLIITAISVALAAYAYIFSIVLSFAIYIYSRNRYGKEFKDSLYQNESLIFRFENFKEEDLNDFLNFLKEENMNILIQSFRKLEDETNIHIKVNNMNDSLLKKLYDYSDKNKNLKEMQFLNYLD